MAGGVLLRKVALSAILLQTDSELGQVSLFPKFDGGTHSWLEATLTVLFVLW